jgi:hypothetical protein
MTEPDEALLWAREYWADRSERQGFSDIAYAYRSGKSDKSLRQEAHAYRAGQAASAERIKALEYDLMWTDQAWEATQEAVVYGYTLMDKQDERIKALERELRRERLRHLTTLTEAFGGYEAEFKEAGQ